MTQTFTYDGATLSNVKRDSVSLQEVADMGREGTGSFTVDDAAGTATIVGHKLFTSVQDAGGTAVQRTWTGYVVDRDYSRGSYVAGAAREIEAEAVDLNAVLAFKVIRGSAWKRPAETISDRLTALLASSFLTGLVADNGFVDYPSTTLDATDYRGQRPVDVIRDMAERAGYNFFVYWDNAAAEASLWFDDPNASTDFSSTLRISNVESDIDSSTTFAASQDTKLRRSPGRVVSGVWLPFKKGNVYRTRASTEDTYEPRDGVAPNANVKRRAKARLRADKYLFHHRNEEDVITTRLRLPAAKLNLVRAGQRIEAKFSHFDTEGYGIFRWFRIVERTVTHPLNDDNTYDVDLILSPQEGGCSVTPTLVQHRYVDAPDDTPTNDTTETYNFTSTTVTGNLIVVAIITGNTTNGNDIASAPSGWTWALQNDHTDAAEVGDVCNIFWKESEGESSITVTLDGTPSGGRRVVLAEYTGLTNPVLYDSAISQQDAAPGYGIAPAIDYPAGPAAVLLFGFMADGPQGSDSLAVEGTSLTLRTSIAGGLHAASEVALADMLRDGTAGTTAVYPAAGGWRILFLGGDDKSLNVGLTFVGDNC